MAGAPTRGKWCPRNDFLPALMAVPFSLPHSHSHSHSRVLWPRVDESESEKRMEEEIICNRWKDLADEPTFGPGLSWVHHAMGLSLPSATAVTLGPVTLLQIMMVGPTGPLIRNRIIIPPSYLERWLRGPRNNFILISNKIILFLSNPPRRLPATCLVDWRSDMWQVEETPRGLERRVRLEGGYISF